MAEIVLSRFAAAAALALAAVTPALGDAQDRRAAEPSDPTVSRISQYVAVRDGTRLAVNVYRPAAGGRPLDNRYPVVFAFTPYRARYYKEGKIVDLIDSPTFALRDLVRSGYVVATADIRGKGASFGARRGFLDQTEAHDGYDIIQWLAAKPYTTGTAGMVGCSYLGGTTMLVAGTLPPALRAVFTGATDLDKYSFVRNGGITAQFNTRPDEPLDVDAASVPVDADKDGSLLRQAVAQHARNTPMAPLWEGMPYRDSVSPLTHNRFWEEVGPYTHLKALKSPQLAWYFWGNWSDEPTEQMILAAANIPSKLIIGPGGHCAPPTQFSITGEQRRFFDHYLKGIDNGIEREPRYTWWREGPNGTGELVRSNVLPGVGVKRTALYFRAPTEPASLAPSSPPASQSKFRTDYDVGATDYFAFWPPVMDGKGLTYTSQPLAADAAMRGYPIVRVRTALDRTDAPLFAYLEDVAADGKASVIAFGRLLASQRKLSTPPYNKLDLPYHSGLAADAMPMRPGVPATLEMALSPRAYTFAAGHRIRVTLAGADPRQRNLAQIRQTPPPEYTVYAGGSAGSRIEIPFKTRPSFRTDDGAGETGRTTR